MATPDEELRQTILAYGADIQRQMREMFDLAALSDPTDTHSLEELRAHLIDEGMLPDLDTPLTEAQWDIVHREYERGTAVLRELSGRPARGAAAMAREEQQPMSERQWLKDVGDDEDMLIDENKMLRAREAVLLAEVERLRAREAALLEVVRAVANGHLLCTCGMTFYPERPPSYSSATFIVSSDIRHRADCPIEQARALLASDSQS